MMISRVVDLLVYKHLLVLKVGSSHLDADLVGLGRSHLDLLHHHRLVGLPGHCRLALYGLGDAHAT